MKKETLVIVPGLGDGNRLIRWSAKYLDKQLRLDTQAHLMTWRGEEQHSEPKLEGYYPN